jgi:hypothetical protein
MIKERIEEKKKLVDKNLSHVHDIYTKAEIGVGIDLL